MSSKLRERRIQGSRVYTGRILDLDVDHVLLANGHETVREVVRHRGAVVVLPLLKDQTVILVRQYRYPVDEIMLELPAGKIDPGESPVDCARRELKEETGLAAKELEALGTFFTTPGFSDERLHAFLAEGLEPPGRSSPDADELLETVRLPVRDVVKMATEGEVRDAKTLVTLFLWERSRARVG